MMRATLLALGFEWSCRGRVRPDRSAARRHRRAAGSFHQLLHHLALARGKARGMVRHLDGFHRASRSASLWKGRPPAFCADITATFAKRTMKIETRTPHCNAENSKNRPQAGEAGGTACPTCCGGAGGSACVQSPALALLLHEEHCCHSASTRCTVVTGWPPASAWVVSVFCRSPVCGFHSSSSSGLEKPPSCHRRVLGVREKVNVPAVLHLVDVSQGAIVGRPSSPATQAPAGCPHRLPGLPPSTPCLAA